MGTSGALGVPGVPGQHVLGPVEEGFKNRADPAYLSTLRPGGLVFPLRNKDTLSQPYGQQFLCTETQTGHSTAAVEERGGGGYRPALVDAGTVSSLEMGSG